MKPSGPLLGTRVLDLSGSSGLHCSKLFADLGADVIKIERPGGDSTRNVPPFKDDQPSINNSLYFLHFNANKRGITLDLSKNYGITLFQKLVSTADVILETSPPGYMESLGIGYSSLKEINPRIVVTSVTPFGHRGPYKSFRATDIVSFAMGGLMALSGEPDRPPCVAPGEVAYGMASAFAALGTLVAIYHSNLTGKGQQVDTSAHASSVHIAGYAVPVFSATGHMGFRKTWSERTFDINDLYPCTDGFVRFCVLPKAQWDSMVEWLGSPEILNSPVFADQQFRRENSEIIDPYVLELTESQPKNEIYLEGQGRHIAVTPVNTPKDFVESEQTEVRGLFTSLAHSVMGEYKHYGPIHKFSGTPGSIYRSAPLVGEHNQEIFCGELGLSPRQLSVLAASGVI